MILHVNSDLTCTMIVHYHRTTYSHVCQQHQLQNQSAETTILYENEAESSKLWIIYLANTMLFCSRLSCRHQNSRAPFPPSSGVNSHKQILNHHKAPRGRKYWQISSGLDIQNSNLLKCRHMPPSLSKQTEPSLIKWHWSGGVSFSFYSLSLSSLDFSLSLGDSSANHLAPNELLSLLLSLCIVIGSVSRWWLAGRDAGSLTCPSISASIKSLRVRPCSTRPSCIWPCIYCSSNGL